MRNDRSIYRTYEKSRRKNSGRLTGKKIAGRIALSFFTVILLLVFSVYLLGYVVAHGPSESVRNMLVLSAKQASATKWIPSLFLDEETINKIVEDSEKVTVDVMSAADYAKQHEENAERKKAAQGERDEWEGSYDGVQLLTDSGDTFKAYVMLIKDPSRVFVGISSEDYKNATVGMNIYDLTAKYDAYAAINGGEFADPGGAGSGAQPIGLTYSRGECVWNQAANRTFIGFDRNDRLIVTEGMSADQATALGIRDCVMFQNGNTLISTYDGNVNLYYASGNTGTAQRTAIGQREDGTVIFIVTDGRAASSLGATHNDMIDMMVKYGAVTAAMLDGGSSAMMYCENYYNLYDEFKGATLDEYQERGLVNKYKAFTSPRTIPTYFVVSKGVGN